MLAPLRDNRNRQQVVRSVTFPASVEGWDAISPLAAMKELRAVELKNWFPQPGFLEVRRGYQPFCRVALGTVSVESLMVYHGLTSALDKLFAAAGGKIYDASSSSPSTSVSGLSSNRWQWVDFSNSGANYLYCVNGVDPAEYYNGTAWAQPSISGASSSDFVHVNVHKRRLWFTQINSTKVWYLAADAVQGTATAFDLGSLFTQGGYLNAMATWTIDGGLGPDDYAVFISSRGQVAVYQGTDPSSASTWGIVGVYDLPAPIGRKCFVKYGGNLLYLSVAGVLQLNLALQTDQAQVTTAAITQRINTAFNTAARSYKDNFGWDMTVYPKGTRLIVNIPTEETSEAKQYVMNTLTGAWCEFDNHNACCWAHYKDRIFFGGVDGVVYEADQGSADILTAITATGQTAYKAPFSPGSLKRCTMIQPLVVTSGSSRPSVGISTDFNETSSLSTPSGVSAAASLWDVGIWDSSVWGGSVTYSADWTSTPALGRWISVKFQATTGSRATGATWGEGGVSSWVLTSGTAFAALDIDFVHDRASLLDPSVTAHGGRWGVDRWGVTGASDETVQLNGFVVLAEVGGYV